MSQTLEDRVAKIELALDELRQRGFLSRPLAARTLRTIDVVPRGHKRGECVECGGYHPIDGQPGAAIAAIDGPKDAV